MVERADALARELSAWAEAENLSARELLVVVTLAGRLLARTFPGCRGRARAAVLEGHATFDAVAGMVEFVN